MKNVDVSEYGIQQIHMSANMDADLAPIQVALFYKYVPVPDPDAAVIAQKALCERLGLAGRLRLALEGINGLVAGGPAAIERYRAAMEAQPLFAGIQSVTIPPRCNLGTRPNPNSSPPLLSPSR